MSAKRTTSRAHPSAAAPLPPVAIIVSRYNATITGAMERGAIERYAQAGGRVDDLIIIDAPGAFELVALTAAAIASRRVAAVVTLGCIIKGETRHDEVLGDAVTHELARLSAQHAMPIGLGVLTVNTAAQARERAGGRHGNKGAEAMSAVLMCLDQTAALTGRGVKRPSITEARPDKAASKRGAKR